MKPAGHVAISTAIGAGVAGATGEPLAVATAIAAGVFIDADHSLDYYHWFVRRKTDRVFFLLHGWEYLGLLLVAGYVSAWNPLVLGALGGYASHLVADQIANHAYAFTYFLTYRARHGFRIDRVSPWTVEGSRRDLLKVLQSMPWGQRYAHALLARLDVLLPADHHPRLGRKIGGRAARALLKSPGSVHHHEAR